jgi:hypothetical protein
MSKVATTVGLGTSRSIDAAVNGGALWRRRQPQTTTTPIHPASSRKRQRGRRTDPAGYK